MATTHFDTLILGSGEAGKFIGWSLSFAGQRVGCIERKYLGGSCPNIACLPSKNFIHSAQIAHDAANANEEGLFVAEAASINMKAVKQRKQRMVDGLMEVHEGRFKASGLELIRGNGRFVGPKAIEVTASDGAKSTLTAETVVISTGSRSPIPDILGLKESNPLTHVELLDLDVLPKHLAIIGGGYIALEFAQCLRRLGSQVTVITHSDHILPKEDLDVSSALQKILENEGVEFHTATNITSINGHSGDAATLSVTKRESSQVLKISASHILVATGRVPNTEDLDLKTAGIAQTPAGHIDVDAQLRSKSAAGVFAVGDCAGSPHFTHVAYDDFRVVKDVLLGQGKRVTTGRQVPFTLFTSPELARVGLTETQAQNQGIAYRIAKHGMPAFLRTMTLGETEGFAKVLVGENDRVVGFTALGPGVGELLPVVQLAMKEDLPYTSIADLVATHPTLGEGLTNLFEDVRQKQ